MEGNPALGIANLRQLATLRPQGCCVGLLGDIRQIHTAARQLFHSVLGQRFIDPATLEKLLWSLDRQIEAGQDLQPQLSDCGASEDTQTELADLVAFFEATRHSVELRLGKLGVAPRPRQP